MIDGKLGGLVICPLYVFLLAENYSIDRWLMILMYLLEFFVFDKMYSISVLKWDDCNGTVITLSIT